MNRALRFTSIFALLMILVLLINLTIIQAFSQDKYAHNALNRRNFYEAKAIPRGQISAGGQVLASSHPDDNGYYQRSYDNSPVAFSHVLGYLSDVYGAAGIESSYNGVLNGTEVGASQFFDHLIDSKPKGNNVELTLIPQVQELAYHQLADAGYEGSVVALRPSTGEILAMASTPSYDPNSIVNQDTAENAWAELTTSDGDPLLNHAAQESLPPGSIFKIITTAAGLEAGYNANSQLTGAPEITLPGTTQTLTNYAGQPCGKGGPVTLATAFALSCNTAFVEMGLDLGADKLRHAADAFGIGESYDLGVTTTPGTLGDLADQGALGQSSIGQRDVTMTALQAALMAGVISNGGTRMEPHLVSRVTSPDLKEVSKVKPKELNQAVTPEIAAQIKELMRGSERSTSGYAGQDIASKTGTAEHGGAGTPPHTWYVAFAPQDGADVAVGVVVKNGGSLGASATGGKVASPIGRAVLNAALQAAR
ncbi:peptidoglycan D,D-transpeptidase FtsI family protein [Corynebacterium uberis]|uniref:peptidoglycan D,D-transpeptidase FtsI family protein n=1 Tax=Corynebacterium TaxID=1716 RepID=UPI001D0B9A67|nr:MULTISPECIES: penicillin-binding protein 2 [Corynebacterium]MCZ9310122.1 penicillin-binding protein 2 [Corynebacterium sp. c6VSa_13]UDL73266.1 penicillin-binding protein 2 [Corynebacterium uberis]UDL75857.1 penicillin-binding protein 2 [Corynebacterium uberis]UDL78069.1 penicillin-binding protein 2 [Corynebacterium uberis]UDL80352.1 penicillin-binding protein 2 [Corynebacterium uberis]